MNTWKEVRAFIRANYELEVDKGDTFVIIFQIDDQRRQTVFVQSARQAGSSDAIGISIRSPIGEIKPKQLPAVLEAAARTGYGMVKVGPTYYLHSFIPMMALSGDLVNLIMQGVAIQADQLEERFLGVDKY